MARLSVPTGLNALQADYPPDAGVGRQSVLTGYVCVSPVLIGSSKTQTFVGIVRWPLRLNSGPFPAVFRGLVLQSQGMRTARCRRDARGRALLNALDAEGDAPRPQTRMGGLPHAIPAGWQMIARNKGVRVDRRIGPWSMTTPTSATTRV